MSENPENKSDLSEEFRNLGKSMKNFLESAWSSEERKNLQQELENGVNELAASITEAADEFTKGETGQQLKKDWENFEDRVESGELQNKIRAELKNALQMASDELNRTAENLSSQKSSADQNE